MSIRPLPDIYGTGFVSDDAISTEGYRFEQAGRYRNYHFTEKNWCWPLPETAKPTLIIDGFSPNLNKQLHVGHLRNLAIAASLSRILIPSKFVALLGHSLGVEKEAYENLKSWFRFVGYHPQEFSDLDVTEKACIKGRPGVDDKAGCEVWPGPAGDVVIRRSDGRPTYPMHDLSFSKIASPHHYLTGAEQREHFVSLGFEDKHLPMGLVLDPASGKKMKSRDGTAMSAEDAMKLVMDRLDETSQPRNLAWNVLAWNFLHCSRSQNVKFSVEEWTRPESPGLYITYSFARISSAIDKGKAAGTWHPAPTNLTDLDIKLLGCSSYFTYYKNLAIEQFDPAPLAKFAADLSKRLGSVYHGEMIADGRPAFQFAVEHALKILFDAMDLLRMFKIESV